MVQEQERFIFKNYNTICGENMNWKKVLIGGIVAGVVLLVLMFTVNSFIGSLIHPTMQQEFQNGAYRPFTDPLMSYIFVHPFVIAIVMAYIYYLFSPFKVEKPLMKGLKYGLVVWLVAGLPGMLMTYSGYAETVTSGPMVLSWTVTGLINMLAAGLVIAYLDKKVK